MTLSLTAASSSNARLIEIPSVEEKAPAAQWLKSKTFAVAGVLRNDWDFIKKDAWNAVRYSVAAPALYYGCKTVFEGNASIADGLGAFITAGAITYSKRDLVTLGTVIGTVAGASLALKSIATNSYKANDFLEIFAEQGIVAGLKFLNARIDSEAAKIGYKTCIAGVAGAAISLGVVGGIAAGALQRRFCVLSPKQPEEAANPT